MNLKPGLVWAVFYLVIGKTTLNEVLHQVKKKKKKAVFFLFKTIHRKEKKKLDPKK